MVVRTITNSEEFACLREPWNALAGDMPFHSWDWLATWWTHYGAPDGVGGSARRRLHTLLVYQKTGANRLRVWPDNRGACTQTPVNPAGRLIGIAPFYLERTVTRGRVLRLLGTGEVCTDHLSLITGPDDRRAVARALADHLTDAYDGWDRIELAGIDSGDRAVSAFVQAMENRDCSVSHKETDACWQIELPTSWDAFLQLQSKSHRKQLRRLQRGVLESTRIAWHQVQSEQQLSEAWSILVDLHQQRRHSLGEPGCFASRPFYDFHKEVAERLLPKNQLRLSWLELDGAPLAAEYHFTDGRITYAYQGGVDPERLDEEPGRLSTMLCIQAAIDAGQTTFDFMRGDEAYKAHWRARPCPTVDFHISANRRFARIRGQVVETAGAMADWMKAGAGAVSGRSLGGTAT